ncbi:hypothetical protein ACOSQ2_008003 [Xanthoceras sorbifolium]
MIDGMHFCSKMKISCLSLARWGLLTITIILSISCQSHQFFHLKAPLRLPHLPLASSSSPPPPTPPPPTPVQNPRLSKAYIALTAWKKAITSDPQNFTANWYGPDVCSYNGVYCTSAPDDSYTTTVAGVDLNNADIAGTLPTELGLLTDLALFHINTNRFCGPIPDSFRDLKLLYEFDISNNQFTGKFPPVLLCLPSLKFLDIRYNGFDGGIPPELFDIKLDALFINNNKFRSSLPKNIGNSTVSVLVLANNDFNGCVPSSLTTMAGTLNELILTNAGLTGCLQPEIGLLNQLTVFDVSNNRLVGSLPESIAEMKNLEQLNVANNNLSGDIPNSICSLPRLENFTYSFNYFCKVPETCLNVPEKDDQKNCIPNRPLQRSPQDCNSLYSIPVDCGAFGCSPPPRSPPSPSPPMHKPPPVHN